MNKNSSTIWRANMEGGSSLPEFKDLRHARVWKVLESLDSEFLYAAKCYFGGGTRTVLVLNEYRFSEDIDFLCADNDGYRALRSAISENSLGRILKRPVSLVRSVRADRYGIRTVLDVDGNPMKFEIISEGRVRIDPDPKSSMPVLPLDETSCFAEKFLANADRWADRSVLSRDVIDLAFMSSEWCRESALAGLQRAMDGYGEVVLDSTRKAVKLLSDSHHFRRCVTELAVTDSRKLRAGLRTLSNLIDEAGSVK